MTPGSPAVQRGVLIALVVVMVAVYAKGVFHRPQPPDGVPAAAQPQPPAGQVEAAEGGAQPWSGMLAASSEQRAAQHAKQAELAWARDPFLSGRGSGPAGGFSLSGILWDATAPIAIINGQMLRVGEEIDGYRVTEISHDRVSLTNGDHTSQLLISP